MSSGKPTPTPNTLYASGNGLTRYRAAFTSLAVFARPDNGRRIEVNDDGRMVIFDLDATQAAGLAGLLT